MTFLEYPYLHRVKTNTLYPGTMAGFYWNRHIYSASRSVQNHLSLLITAVLLLSGLASGLSQNIVDKLDRVGRSSFNAVAFNNKNFPLDTTRGFFISADGLAITTASLFEKGDTIIFSDEKDHALTLHRIVAVHNFANLALIQLRNPRAKEIEFIQPAKTPFNSQGDILGFVNPLEGEKGLGYGFIGSILRVPFLGRCAKINLQAGAASESAPIVDANGDFIGLYYFTESRTHGILLPTSIITDDHWISVNQNWWKFKTDPRRAGLTSRYYAQGLIYQGQSKWLEAARTYTSLLKITPDDPLIHALRALTRFNYGNNVGGREDFTYSLNLDPDGYYPYYARAISYLNAKERAKAVEDLFLAADKNPAFVDAFLEIGRIQVLFGDIRHAFASFTYALETDSLLAEAWYERGRLYIQHSSNQENALSDLSTAARLNPALPGVYTLIGNIKFSRQNYLEAILDFDKAINQDGTDTHALMNRGMAHFNTGLKDKACADWEQAGKLGHLQAFKLLSRHCSEMRKSSFTRH